MEEGPLQLKSLRRSRCGGNSVFLNPRNEHFIAQAPAFTKTDPFVFNRWHNLEVSEKEEEHPRNVSLSLGAEQRSLVHDGERSSESPTALPPILGAELSNVNLWVLSGPPLPAPLPLQFPRKCQLKHAASAAELFPTEVLWRA